MEVNDDQTQEKFQQLMKCLEWLPNELLLLIVTHLSSVDLIEAFYGLNHRFNLIVMQSVRHVTVVEGTSKKRFDRCILLVKDIVETIYFDGKPSPQIFPATDAFANLRAIVFHYSPVDYVELKVHGPSAGKSIHSCLEVFQTCHIWDVEEGNDTQQTEVPFTTPPCPAVVRVSVHTCSERGLLSLCSLVPNLSYLRVRELVSSDDDSCFDAILPSLPQYPHLKQLHLTSSSNRLDSIYWIGRLINYYQSSLECLSLDIALNNRIDGHHLQNVLEPCRRLEKVTFSFNYWLEPGEELDLLQPFQSDWWLDARRPPVLVLCNGYSQAFVVSMPCRLNEYAWFPIDPNDWTINKGSLDAPEIRFTKQTSIRFANSKQQLMTLDLVSIVTHVFRAPNQELSIPPWGFVASDLLIEQLINTRWRDPWLSRVAVFDLRSCDLDRLDAKTLLVWLLLAPNIRLLNLCQGTINAKIQLANRLKVLLDDDERLRSVTDAVDEVHVFYMTDPLNYATKQHVCQMYSNIFRKPIIR